MPIFLSPIERAQTNIKLIKSILEAESKGRLLPRSKCKQLQNFTGWGNTDLRNKLFPADNMPLDEWDELYEELIGLIGESRVQDVKQASQYAHYTPMKLVRFIYDALKRMGVERGLLFEPGVGSGHFIQGIPNNLNVHYTGIEQEYTSYLVAKHRFPKADLVQGDFIEQALPERHFDLVLSNVPFSQMSVSACAEFGNLNLALPDYFIVKSLDALENGGLGVFVAPTGTLDKISTKARREMSKRANLLAAFRLPQGLFEETASSNVQVDVLFFQRSSKPNKSVRWYEASEHDGVLINQYFLDHPRHVLGELKRESGQFGTPVLAVKPTGDIDADLKHALQQLPTKIYDNPDKESIQLRIAYSERAPESRLEGEVYLDKANHLRQVEQSRGVLIPVRGQSSKHGLTQKAAKILSDFVPLKDAVNECLAAMAGNQDLQSCRFRLDVFHKTFIKRHGHLLQRKYRGDEGDFSEPVLSVICRDPFGYKTTIVERYDEIHDEISKGAIYTKNLILTDAKQPDIKTAEDALKVSLNRYGRINLDAICDSASMSEHEVLLELGDLLFKDPMTKRWLARDEYLSGNILEKLREAKDVAKRHPEFDRNVEALTAVVPPPQPITSVPFDLGALWVPDDIITKFAQQELQMNATIHSWSSSEQSRRGIYGRAWSPESHPYQTTRVKGSEILLAAMNGKPIRVSDMEWDGNKEKSVTNHEETESANDKVRLLKERFIEWVLESRELGSIIAEVYQRKFNCYQPRKYDGSFLTIPGLSNAFTLRPSQKNLAWRIICDDFTLGAHAVGSGKTLSCIVGVMERKRLGLTELPIVACLKSTLSHWANEWHTSFPTANLLVVDEKQLDKKNLKRFLAQLLCARGAYDAVIMTHESMARIGLSQKTLQRFIQADMQGLRKDLEGLPKGELRSLTRRTIERQIESLEQLLKKDQRKNRYDFAITWEEISPDLVLADESQVYRRLSFKTAKPELKGVTPNGSAIAYDMYLKTRYLRQTGGAMVWATGTPLTNTLAEVYTLQRFFQPEVLEAQNTESFDSWANTHAMMSSNLEMQPSGNYKYVDRLLEFKGLVGLARSASQFMDVLSDQELREMIPGEHPTIETGGMRMITAPMTPEFHSYQNVLAGRLETIALAKRRNAPGADNVLVVMTDASKASIDLGLVGITKKHPSKLDLMIEEVFKIWKETANHSYTTDGCNDELPGATQVVFSELRNTDHMDLWTYAREKLVEKGVPATEIAFIQDYSTRAKKQKLNRLMDSGRVRILFGNTKSCGTGVNIQKRLIASHNLDADWVPQSMVQRNGRIDRVGNQNNAIQILAYVTQGSLDSYRWGLLHTKQNMIDAFLTFDFTLNELDECSYTANQFAMARAVASGDERVIRHAGILSEVKRLRRLRKAHEMDAAELLKQRRLATEAIQQCDYESERLTKLTQSYRAMPGERFDVEFEDKRFYDRKQFIKAIHEWSMDGGTFGVGTLWGLPFYAETHLSGRYRATKLWVGTHPIQIGDLRVINTEIISPYVTDHDRWNIGMVTRLENIARSLKTSKVTLDSVSRNRKAFLEATVERAEAEFLYLGELEQKEDELIDIESDMQELPYNSLAA